jgi:ABC-type nitrate/sulfonate/bicarbonate transport system permease component
VSDSREMGGAVEDRPDAERVGRFERPADRRATGRPRARAPARGPRVPDWALPWISIAVVLAFFELLSRAEILSSRSFPPVTDMLSTLWGELGTTELWEAVGQTLQGWALGLGIAAALAIPLGIIIGSSQLLYRSVRVIVEFLRPIPSVALIPLAILIYGTGLQSKVFLAAFASFWVLLVQTLYGVQDVDPVATDTARSFGFSRMQRLFRVTLPSAIPYIATGVRMASTVALILAVTAELVIGSPGLGQSINIARSGGNVEKMYALIIVTGMLGWILNDVFARIERRVLHWHPSQRSTQEAAPA